MVPAGFACPNASPVPGLPQLLPYVAVLRHLEQQSALWDAAVRGKLKPLLAQEELEAQLLQAAANVRRILAQARPQLRIGGPMPLRQHEVLRQILRSGRVQTQFETHHSGGAFNPNLRASLEAELFGYALSLPPAQRPVYGYLTPGDYEPEAVESYGHLALRLKPQILSRTTVTISDTLDRVVLPAPYCNIPVTSLIPSQSGRVHAFLTRLLQAMHLSELELHYVEAQYHGGVGLGDVECVLAWHLHDVPADLQQQCRQVGLPIREFGR